MPVDRMAQRLALSSRTLQRRLMSIGMSYSLVLEQVRRELASHYLRMPLTVEKVALLLGYSDLTAFIRAHRRWTGVSPGRSRREGGMRLTPAPLREAAFG
jgi:AraC-like DNA-binding protein